jgi:exodeoxyribonuclease V gamma subunit
MFRLHTSNDAAKLADALGGQLCAARADPLVPARVLVPQAGIKRWLQVYLAERLGVVANVEFTPPAQFAWELLRAARPDLPFRSPFDVEILRWHLYALLDGPLDGHALAPLRAYLGSEDDPLRRFALGFELARMYERMQGYRRDTLLAWERGDGGDDWQAELWRRLLPRMGGVSRAARVDEWLRAFDPEYPPGRFNDKPAPPGLPAHFACFACANVSPDVLRMLAVAGLHCDVDFHLPLPSREYLGDTPRRRGEVRERLADEDRGNPLIVSLGGAATGFVALLYGYEHVQPDEEDERFDTAIDRATLLGRVRDDILRHAAPDGGDRTALPDDSLQFHACHTPLREVQTLHDELLAMLEKDASLQPRDIAVMMPDVAAYRPAIEAVFGGIRHDDPRWIPFNLGDTGAGTHPAARLFLDLLDVPTSRWEANDILDMLAAPGVMRRFDLDADALERLSRRVREAGVRWGEDERARADCGGYREFSWAFGIDRMLAGFACADADDALVGGVAPLQGVEGTAFAHLDAVLAITETWRSLRDLSLRARPASEWQRRFNEILDSLYQPDPRDLAETRALERVRGALAQLARDCEQADANLELPWADVRAFLREQLANPDPAQHLFTGGVTFCGMVPLRVVPFRVICLLGMDEGAFPRRESGGLDPLLADRRAGKARRGDRDVRADDRLLFLQLLAAARDAFYVSWVGRDPHGNTVIPPSVVVAELIDVVREGYLLPAPDEVACKTRDAMLPRIAPLHPFDPSLFARDAGPARSFHAEWLPAARAPQRSAEGLPPFVAHALPAPDVAAKEIRLDALKRFFADPARGFLEDALQLRLPRDADEDADVEPLEPDNGLLRYQLTSTLLARGDADAEHVRTLLGAQGALPPGELADTALAIARSRADALRTAIDDFTGGAAQREDIEGALDLDGGTRLAGTVGDTWPAGLVRETAGKLNGKRALLAWIDQLFATAASDTPVACRLFWMDNGDAKHCDLDTPTPEQARAKLAELVAAMRRGMQAPLPLFPKASWDALKRTRQKGQAEFAGFIAAIVEKAGAEPGDAYARDSEFTQADVRLAWRGVDFAALGDDGAQALHAAADTLLPVVKPAKASR